MIEEKAFVDFIIAGVLILSFSGFYSYKMSMMRKLHKDIYGGTYAIMLETKMYGNPRLRKNSLRLLILP